MSCKFSKHFNNNVTVVIRTNLFFNDRQMINYCWFIIIIIIFFNTFTAAFIKTIYQRKIISYLIYIYILLLSFLLIGNNNYLIFDWKNM